MSEEAIFRMYNCSIRWFGKALMFMAPKRKRVVTSDKGILGQYEDFQTQ